MAASGTKGDCSLGGLLSLDDPTFHSTWCYQYDIACCYLLACLGLAFSIDYIRAGLWVVIQYPFYSLALLVYFVWELAMLLCPSTVLIDVKLSVFDGIMCLMSLYLANMSRKYKKSLLTLQKEL